MGNVYYETLSRKILIMHWKNQVKCKQTFKKIHRFLCFWSHLRLKLWNICILLWDQITDAVKGWSAGDKSQRLDWGWRERAQLILWLWQRDLEITHRDSPRQGSLGAAANSYCTALSLNPPTILPGILPAQSSRQTPDASQICFQIAYLLTNKPGEFSLLGYALYLMEFLVFQCFLYISLNTAGFLLKKSEHCIW